MYTIHADGKLLFSSLSEDVGSIVLSPKLSLNINKAGSLSFVIPPGNNMHGSLKKLKSIITVEQDGVQIARGRATETELDTYNQINVHCDGEKSFLMDSVFHPGSLSGKVRDFFKNLISNHNSQVDVEKRFTVGVIDVVDANAVMQPDSRSETRVYWNTLDMIEDSLLNVYGGYLRTRTVGGTHYIDWVKEYGETNSQPIEFSVNLLDLTDKADAGEVFTVLIPLGASEIGDDGEYTDPLSIASVNNGLNYIQDDEAVALYGKIWRTHTWSYIEDPAQLLAKGREYLKTGVALETLTLKAVDMHFTDGNIQPIRIGDRVHILSNPHGIDRTMVCSQIEIDLLNPENTVYTFGEPPRTLTDNFVKAEEEVDGLTGYRGGGGGRKSAQEEVSDIIRWANFFKDEHEARIGMVAGEKYSDIDGNTSLKQAYIDIEGAVSKITMLAGVEYKDITENLTTLKDVSIVLNGDDATIGLVAKVSEQGDEIDDTRSRLSAAGIEIDGEAASVKVLATKEALDEKEKSILKVTSSEISTKVSKDGVISSINQSAEEITINASKINLEGYVTTGNLKATITDAMNSFSDNITTGTLYVSSTAIMSSATIREKGCTWDDKTVVTGITKPILDGKTIWYVDHSGNNQSLWVATGWSRQLSYDTEEMEYMTSY